MVAMAPDRLSGLRDRAAAAKGVSIFKMMDVSRHKSVEPFVGT